nr:hypothetical protein [Desulfobacterales bacterium]
MIRLICPELHLGLLRKDIRGEVKNLGHGSRITILELADKIKRLLDVDVKTRFNDEREGDIRHSQAQIERLKPVGFEFRYDFDEGLRRLADHLTTRVLSPVLQAQRREDEPDAPPGLSYWPQE